jgi:signal transduction histidine kinase
MDNVDSSLNRVKFNIVELTLEVIHSFEPAYVKKGLYVRFDGPKELIVNVDLEKWKQIVSNLLLNAIKFSEKGFIRIQMENNLDVLVFSVEDQGCGIAANHLSHIFDRFYKVDPASKGSGIGLTIVKVWVEAHGGRIWAESQGRGKGARIILEMPL